MKSKTNPLMTRLETECWHTGHIAETLRRNITVELVDSIGPLLVGKNWGCYQLKQTIERKMKMRIAVVQQNGNPGQPEENREKAITFALQALDPGQM